MVTGPQEVLDNSYLLTCGNRGPPIHRGHVPRPPQWTPETAGSAEPYMYYVLPYPCKLMIRFNLYLHHSKRLTITNNIIEQL